MRQPRTCEPPRPDDVRTTDDLIDRLRALRVWSGLSYREVQRRIVELRRDRGVPELPAYDTIYRCFQPGRTRLDSALVADIAAALLDDKAQVAAWRQAHRLVTGRTDQAGLVAITDAVPPPEPSLVDRAELVAAVLTAHRAGTSMFVLTGMGGTGKTWLAHHLVHRFLAAGHGSHGVLAADLRGFSPDRPPADPAAVLEGFLCARGVPRVEVSRLDLAGRVRKFRQVLKGRDTIVLLDNVSAEDQLGPLLAPDCLTMVTTRNRLAAGSAALTVDVPTFEPTESLQLLSRAADVSTDLSAAQQIAELAGHLPLALAMLAARIQDSPGWSLSDHLERLTEHRSRLRLDDSVDLALAASYEAQTTGNRSLLRMIALHPGRVFDAYAAAALAGAPHPVVQAGLNELVKASLLTTAQPDRYALHDLVSVFAAARGRDEDRAGSRRDALTRMAVYYAKSANRVALEFVPHQMPVVPLEQDAAVDLPPISGRHAAAAWLGSELPNLIAAGSCANDLGRGDVTALLSTSLTYYLNVTANGTAAEILFNQAIASAPDPQSLGRAHNGLGNVHWRRGRYVEAGKHFERAVELRRQAGDLPGMANSLSNVANLKDRQGRGLEALECYREALSIMAAQDRSPNLLRTRAQLGQCLLGLGRTSEAMAEFEACVSEAEPGGFDHIYALFSLALGHEHRGALAQAAICAKAALERSRETGFRAVEPDVLSMLGRFELSTGSADDAVALQSEALKLIKEYEQYYSAALIRNDLAESLRALNRHEEARALLESVVADGPELSGPRELERSLDALAKT